MGFISLQNLILKACVNLTELSVIHGFLFLFPCGIFQIFSAFNLPYHPTLLGSDIHIINRGNLNGAAPSFVMHGTF